MDLMSVIMDGFSNEEMIRMLIAAPKSTLKAIASIIWKITVSKNLIESIISFFTILFLSGHKMEQRIRVFVQQISQMPHLILNVLKILGETKEMKIITCLLSLLMFPICRKNSTEHLKISTTLFLNALDGDENLYESIDGEDDHEAAHAVHFCPHCESRVASAESDRYPAPSSVADSAPRV